MILSLYCIQVSFKKKLNEKYFFYSLLFPRGVFNWRDRKPNTVNNTCVLIGKLVPSVQQC